MDELVTTTPNSGVPPALREPARRAYATMRDFLVKQVNVARFVLPREEEAIVHALLANEMMDLHGSDPRVLANLLAACLVRLAQLEPEHQEAPSDGHTYPTAGL